MTTLQDGPTSPYFYPVPISGNWLFEHLTTGAGITEGMANLIHRAPRGLATAWGIPFQIGDPLLLQDHSITLPVAPIQARWLVFMHTSDGCLFERGSDGLLIDPHPQSPFTGEGRLNEHIADYIVLFDDGSEVRNQIRRRYQIGMYSYRWGEQCFTAVPYHKPQPVRAHHEQVHSWWGDSQTRTKTVSWVDWNEWLWAWQNPNPEKTITGFRFEPAGLHDNIPHSIIISAISAGDVEKQPLRWRSRRKAVLRLPEGVEFKLELDEDGLLAHIQIDLGQVISAVPRRVYPNQDWTNTYNNQLPETAPHEVIVEYTSQQEACFHLWDGQIIPVAEVEQLHSSHLPIQPVSPAIQRVNLKVIEKNSRKLVAAKLHMHGEVGEYLAPVDRHRIINPAWFEDYSIDFTHVGVHPCTYIAGETDVDLPLGRIFIEVSKGFEIRPVRKVIDVSSGTQEILIEIEKVLPWREHGWVTADTHVHFLSPGSAMLEGAAEGVNVVNLLASQWGELMTNVGDFDGRTTWGAKETGGGPEENGEYLVRVGTENRQHVLGHISLLGYRGRIIAPMTTGGPDESALGDPVEVLLTEWARQCRKQGGLVVLPHFPNPRAEHAASIISGDIDALEATSWERLYQGIDPYSLADWYRYLNCGYIVPIVGGTDKMTAATAVGTLRTYARILGQHFNYDAWMAAIRRGETFATCGPLLEFFVEGQPAGGRLVLPPSGGTVNVIWQVATVTVPVTQVELIVNGKVRESAQLAPEGGTGTWSVKLDGSSWLALLVRGHYPEKPPVVVAHSSAVMVEVTGTELLSPGDAITILDQIDGSLAYLDVIGTRAEQQAYQRMRLVLQTAYRSLHNRMHQQGYYHQHPNEP